MNLDDKTAEGAAYNTHNTRRYVTTNKDFDIIAETIANGLFNKKPLHRRVYESIKATTKHAASRFTRRRR